MHAWKVIVTVGTLGVIAVAGIAFNQREISFLAAGALAGYLGKVNGADSGSSGSDTSPPIP